MKMIAMRYAEMLLCTTLAAMPAMATDRPDIELRLVVPCAAGDAGLTLQGSGENLCLSHDLILGTSDIIKAGLVDRSEFGNAVRIFFGSDAQARFFAVTTANVGQRIAIVVDGTLVTAPVVRDPINSDRLEISGLTDEAALTLVTKLNTPKK